MLMLDKTSERLRSKHVRTLELLQKTLDENAELRDRVSQLQKGTLHLTHDAPRSNRVNELEDEIDRQRAEHCAKLLACEESARVRIEEHTRTIDSLRTQHQKLQSDNFTLETRLANTRETLQSERTAWQQERLHLLNTQSKLQYELDRVTSGQDNNQERHLVELAALQQELDEQRDLQTEFDRTKQRLHFEITELCTELKQQKELATNQTAELEAARSQLHLCKQQENSALSDLAVARASVSDLEARIQHLEVLLAQAAAPATDITYQQQYAAAITSLQEVEEQNTRLLNENRALQDSLAKMQAQLNELVHAKAPGGSIFATHIDLKRENFHLRAQLEEMKQLQRRYLTTANKKTMKFPALS